MTWVQRLAVFSFFIVPCLATVPLAATELAVGCQGRVIPQSRIIRLAAPADQGTPIVEILRVEEGDAVKAGDVVAVLMAQKPASLLLLQAKQKLDAVTASRDTLLLAEKQAALEIALQKIDANNALATAEASLEVTKIQSTRRHLSDEGVNEIQAQITAKSDALEKMRATRPALVAQLDAAINSAQVQVNETSGAKGRIATAALGEARAAKEISLREFDAKIDGMAGEVTVLNAALIQGLALNKQPLREPAEVMAAEAQVTLAKSRLAALHNYAVATNARYVAEEKEVTSAITEAKAGVQLAENRLAMTRIYAPITGNILRVFARAGEAVGPSGVVEIADLSKMAVEAEVSVADLARVKVGHRAVIRVPGVNKDFSGKVTRIGLRAGAGALIDENPAAFKDLRVMPVFIVLDEPAALAAYTGAQVTVRITHE